MGLFSSNKKNRLGIDIGTAAIKLVELSLSEGRFELANYGLLEINAGSERAPAAAKRPVFALSDSEIASGVRELIGRSGTSTKDVVASIPSFPTFSTTITLPYLSEEDIVKTIPYEARKYIPVPLTEVQLNWAIINLKKPDKSELAATPNVPAGTPTVEVFLVAVPKTEIERYKQIMKNAGLNLVGLELENFAIIRSILGNDLGPSALINIGGRSTSIVIVDSGYQRVSRDYEVASFEITNAIARALSVSPQRAEELKRSLGVVPGDTNIIRQTIISLIDLMIFETSKTIHNYEEARNRKIERIFLLGGFANMPGTAQYFSERLGRQVQIGNALARVVVRPELEPIKQWLNTTFGVAIGLAMKEVK